MDQEVPGSRPGGGTIKHLNSLTLSGLLAHRGGCSGLGVQMVGSFDTNFTMS